MITHVFTVKSQCVCEREREREREGRDIERQSERETERKRERQREKERETERERERRTERERQIERPRDRDPEKKIRTCVSYHRLYFILSLCQFSEEKVSAQNIHRKTINKHTDVLCNNFYPSPSCQFVYF